MKCGTLWLAVLLILSGVIHAADNAELAEMYRQDQAARQQHPIDWTRVAKQDRAHRERVLALLRNGQVTTAKDYLHGAMIMQHGESFDDYRLAIGLSVVAATMDPNLKQARWLSAAAWDRALMNKGVPQWYGTQYQSQPGAPMTLYAVNESAVTDAERAALGVPTLQEVKDFPKQINGGK